VDPGEETVTHPQTDEAPLLDLVFRRSPSPHSNEDDGVHPSLFGRMRGVALAVASLARGAASVGRSAPLH